MSALPEMVEGAWKPVHNLTFGQAVSAAAILRPYLPSDAQARLEAAMELARRCQMIDVVDCFCDGIARMLDMPTAARPAEMEMMLANCQFAAWS